MTLYSTTRVLALLLGMSACAAFAEGQPVDPVPITFLTIESGERSDPLGLFSEEEISEGGSDVQPSIWYATFPVDGGEVDLSILVDAWCGMSECPFRHRIRDSKGDVVHVGFRPPQFGMICQGFFGETPDAITYDPIHLTIQACGQTLDLKE
ncbi:MAG: hypothetical protein IH568_01435 [Burkholderiaceae bacterium]|nr:hypothetical protein [Burkholderiaceae bacterium]